MADRFALVRARLKLEEGLRLCGYDDATGVEVHAPKGNLSWGYGFNLAACGSVGLFDCMIGYLLGQIEAQIKDFLWYRLADETRKSVFLDIAYNDGVMGLRSFTQMLLDAALGNWDGAAAECHVKNLELAGRYKALADLLRKGDTA